MPSLISSRRHVSNDNHPKDSANGRRAGFAATRSLVVHVAREWLREIERRARVAMAGDRMSWIEARSQIQNRLSSQ
jgi:hypothetical protein